MNDTNNTHESYSAAKEAAQFLREEAKDIQMAHTIDGTWEPSTDADVMEHCKNILELAERLEQSSAEGYSAADMATAAAQGFRDGVKHEREACAIVCDKEADRALGWGKYEANSLSKCAEKIRARSYE